jgi:hypothetical protein
VRTPSHTSSPSERPEQAQKLTLGKALTAQRGPTARTRGPGARPLRTLGKNIFDELKGQDTCERPHGQDQLRQGLGRFDRAEHLLHGGIIMSYAVAEA